MRMPMVEERQDTISFVQSGLLSRNIARAGRDATTWRNTDQHAALDLDTLRPRPLHHKLIAFRLDTQCRNYARSIAWLVVDVADNRWRSNAVGVVEVYPRSSRRRWRWSRKSPSAPPDDDYPQHNHHAYGGENDAYGRQGSQLVVGQDVCSGMRCWWWLEHNVLVGDYGRIGPVDCCAVGWYSGSIWYELHRRSVGDALLSCLIRHCMQGLAMHLPEPWFVWFGGIQLL